MIPKTWTFKDSAVAEEFDGHVRQQLPWYNLATDLIACYADHYIIPRSLVYDFGASTGNITRAIYRTVEERKCKLVAIEESAEMLSEWQRCGESEMISTSVDIVQADVLDYDIQPYSVGIVFLLGMFLPVDKRKQWLRQLAEKKVDGGALLIVDKMVPRGGYESTIATRWVQTAKLHQGASYEEIARKELSLTGVQRPLELHEIPDGAREVFRVADFVGFLIT